MAKRAEKKKEPEETYASADLKRYIGALMEENREQIKGISEQFIDFRRTLNFHTGMLQMHEQWFGNIDRKLNSHTEMIGIIMEDISVLKQDVSVLKSDMKSVKDDLKKKVDRQGFAGLERRVSVVESKVR